MAYFPNGTSAGSFNNQCSMCKFGDKACPIYWVQINYNYEACNEKLPTAILNDLVTDKTGCVMFNRFKKDLKITVSAKDLDYIDDIDMEEQRREEERMEE